MKTREHLIDILEKNPLPLTELELRAFLSKSKIFVNKTTIYRSLEYLLKENLIKEVNFGDGKNRYEIANLPHHHHLMCLDCNKIEDVILEGELQSIEKKIVKTKKFRVKNHSLEFFGLCSKCAN